MRCPCNVLLQHTVTVKRCVGFDVPIALPTVDVNGPLLRTVPVSDQLDSKRTLSDALACAFMSLLARASCFGAMDGFSTLWRQIMNAMRSKAPHVKCSHRSNVLLGSKCP